MTDYTIRCSRCAWLASGPAEALPFLASQTRQHFVTCSPHSASAPSDTESARGEEARASTAAATCPGSLIVRTDGSVVACTEDTEPRGCRGRDRRHDGDPVRCFVSSLRG